MLTVLAIVVGTALVGLVAWDAMLTLLHPSGRGPLSYVVNQATWRVVRVVALRALRGRGLSYAGPLAVATNVMAWVGLLWIGYALIYLPFIEDFSFDPTTPFGSRGFAEALYVSGAAITTVGFGDVVATGELLRVLTIVEAASGFGALSAAIAYILSIYPVITSLRSTGLQLHDLGTLELSGAARVVRDTGQTEVAALVRELTENHEHVKRFPVLYYFESGNPQESLSSVVRGSTMLLVALRGAHPDVAPHAPVYADVMERIVDRLLDDLDRDFVGGRRGGRRGAPVSENAEEYDLSALCAVLDPQDTDDRRLDQSNKLVPLLARAEAVLAAVAHEHGHGAEPLFSND